MRVARTVLSIVLLASVTTSCASAPKNQLWYVAKSRSVHATAVSLWADLIIAGTVKPHSDLDQQFEVAQLHASRIIDETEKAIRAGGDFSFDSIDDAITALDVVFAAIGGDG
jgi:hypothetical protein